jgi:hypothetical protein
MQVIRVADIEVNDLAVTVVLPEYDLVDSAGDPKSALAIFDQEPFRTSATSELVVMWRDNRGAVRFIAAPHLHCFFERVNFEQIAGQAGRHVSTDLFSR